MGQSAHSKLLKIEAKGEIHAFGARLFNTQDNKGQGLLLLKIIQFNRSLLLSMSLESRQKGRGAQNQLRVAAELINRRRIVIIK